MGEHFTGDVYSVVFELEGGIKEKSSTLQRSGPPIMLLNRLGLRVLSRRFSSHKAATGLVGLPVSEDGVQELKDVSTKILSEIQVGIGFIY